MENILKISPDKIIANSHQPRIYFDEDALDELAKSIETFGIIQPLSVRKIAEDKYELVAGERRLRASKKAKLETVPVILVDITDKESAAIALLENLQREDLNYIEEARAYRDLLNKHNYTQEQLANEIGKKQSTIANKLRLLKLDDGVIELAIEGGLTERHCRALLKLPDAEIQLEILEIVLEKKLNVKSTELLVDKKLNEINDISIDGKKRIRVNIVNTKLYVNTIKQVFDKFGIDANYESKELEDYLEVVVRIPKNK